MPEREKETKKKKTKEKKIIKEREKTRALGVRANVSLALVCGCKIKRAAHIYMRRAKFPKVPPEHFVLSTSVTHYIHTHTHISQSRQILIYKTQRRSLGRL